MAGVRIIIVHIRPRAPSPVQLLISRPRVWFLSNYKPNSSAIRAGLLTSTVLRLPAEQAQSIGLALQSSCMELSVGCNSNPS